MKVPCSTMFTPLRTSSPFMLSPAHEARWQRAGVALAVAAAYDSAKPIGLREFLGQVPDQAGAARQDGHALERLGRKAHVEQHRRNRGRHVQAQVAPVSPGSTDSTASAMRRNPWRARLRPPRRTVARRAGRVPCAAGGRSRGSRASVRAARAPPPARRGIAAPCDLATAIDAQEQAPRRLRRAEDHRAAAQDAGGHRALDRIGRGGKVMRLACTLGTRPCSAIATSVASSTRAAAPAGTRPSPATRSSR